MVWSPVLEKEQDTMKSTGFILLAAGGVLMALGLVFLLGDKLPFLGRLPGDLHIEGKRSSFHFPVVTCIVLSLILTLLLNLAFGLFRK